MKTPIIQTIGELRSYNVQDASHHIKTATDDILFSLREWRKSFVDERHPVAATLFAAATLICAFRDAQAKQDAELDAWKAFAEQSSKRAVTADVLAALEQAQQALEDMIALPYIMDKGELVAKKRANEAIAACRKITRQ